MAGCVRIGCWAALLFLLVTCGSVGAGDAGAPVFGKPPAATVIGDRVKIEFAADRATDVAVCVEDAGGRIVRHLAAGLLGKSPPAPLRAAALEQALEWDGADDAGRPLPKGAYRVRVSLGLKPQFGRVVDWEPPSLASRGVLGFAVDEQGNIYGLNASLWEGQGGGHHLMVWDRDGRYLRQIMPFRRDVDLKRLPGVAFTELPTGLHVPNDVYFPGALGSRFVMRVRDGRVTLFAPAKQTEDGAVRLVRMMADDGAAPPEGHLGPVIPGQLGKRFPAYLAYSPDGKTVYVAGTGGAGGQVTNTVYRAAWTDKAMQPFITKDAGLGDPRGLATDALGRLYVCDFNNDRIALFSADGKHLKDLPVRGPEQVEVDQKSGAVYVYSVRDDVKRTEGKSLMYLDKAVVKFGGADDWKQAAALDLPKRARHMHDAGPLMVLDSSGREPILYVCYAGRQEMSDHLWKIVSRDGKLVQVEPPIGRHYWPFVRAYCAMAVDRGREEVYLGGRSFDRFYRLNGRTGELADVASITRDIDGKVKLATDHPQVTGLAVDREGRIYVRLMGAWSGDKNWLRRYDRDGRRVPFTKAPRFQPDGALAPGKDQNTDGDLLITQPSRGYHSGGLSVAPNGDIYLVEKAADPATGRQLPGNANSLNVYDADGARKKVGLIPWLSAGAWGPRLDPIGRIYITDAVRPNKPEVKSESTGCLMQFGAKGGEVKLGVAGAAYVTRQDEGKLPPTAFGGANWIYYGVGLTSMGHCVCSACQFDLDGYGRSAVGDVNRYCVKVIDAAGNLVVAFGEYGNRDSAGPKSAVPVPDIPLWEPNAVAISDRAVYVYDRRNHRVLCVDLRYKAEAAVDVKLE